MSDHHTITINDGSNLDISTSFGDDNITSIDISDINDFDLKMLGNQRKLATPPGSSTGGIKISNDIDFVNVEDTAVSFDIKPHSVSNTNDTIRILRDNTPKNYDAPTPSFSSAFAPAPKPMMGSGISFAPSFNTATAIPAPIPTAPAPAPAPAPAATKSWFSGLNPFASKTSTETAPAPVQPSEPHYTPEEESAKKMEALSLLERLDRSGVGGARMTMANTLSEIQIELARRKDSKNLESSLKFQRFLMTTVTNGLEYLNTRYDPFGVSLDGWSVQINENIEDYDEIFEELYDKYKNKANVAPEVRLIMSLGLSASMCHLTNTMFKNSNMPNAIDIMKKNPELARQFANAAAAEVAGPGFTQFMNMPAQQTTPRQHYSAPPSPPRHSPPLAVGVNANIPNLDPRGTINVSTARPEMRGPNGVDDILMQFQMNGRSVPSRDTPAPASVDDSGSVGSGITTETMRNRGISRRKRTTAQPTGASLTLNV